jgi:nucleoside-diphosphate-sugar epimerase
LSSRVIVIGGTGHIGTFLVPRLVEAGHTVISISRGQRQPYVSNPAWDRVEQVAIDRTMSEPAGEFGLRIRDLDPDVVIDLTCYMLDSAQHLVDALRGRVRHFLHCGTIWVHGPAIESPTTEEEPRAPIDDYGRRKAAIESYLLQEARSGFPATILHPGHLVGPGWAPINPAANFNLKLFADLARGSEIALPNFGRETVHHVHADDVAQAFVLAIARPEASMGQSFHTVSPAALTLGGFATVVASWFGKQARICYLPWEEWRNTVSERDTQVTWGHIMRSPNCSIQKARTLLGYEPRYRSSEAVKQAVFSLIENGSLQI